MADGYAVRVGDRDADPAVRAGCGELRELTAQIRIEDAQSVTFAGPVREAKQRGQRKNQLRQDRPACWLSSVSRVRTRVAFVWRLRLVARGTTGAAAWAMAAWRLLAG